MSKIKYYTYTQVKGAESENLLVELKKIINSKKITDYLPEKTTEELNEIDLKLEELNSSLINIDSQLNMLIKVEEEDLIICGGTY